MRRTGRRVTATMVVLAAVTLSACATGETTSPASPAATSSVNPNAPEANVAADIPDNQVYVPFQADSPAGLFTVNVPEGWAKTGQGDTVNFTDKLNTIRIEVLPAETAPTAESVMTTVLPQIQQQASNVTGGKVDTTHRSAGTAVLLSYRADAPPDPITGKVVNDDVGRYAFWKAGAEVVLTLSGPHGSDNVDPWRIVTDSFGWVS